MEAGSLLIEELKNTSTGGEEVVKFRDIAEFHTKMLREEVSEALLKIVKTIQNGQKLLSDKWKENYQCETAKVR